MPHYGKRRILKIVGNGTGRDAGRNRRSVLGCPVCTDNVSESLILVFLLFYLFLFILHTNHNSPFLLSSRSPSPSPPYPLAAILSSKRIRPPTVSQQRQDH